MIAVESGTVRPEVTRALATVGLIALAVGSFFAGLDWVTEGGVNDGDLFAWSWPLTAVAVWAFGTGALIVSGLVRASVAWALIAVGAYLAVLLLHAIVLPEPSALGPLLLLALEGGAVYCAWRLFFRGRLRRLLVWLFALLTLGSLAASSSYASYLLVVDREVYGVVLWQLAMPVLWLLGAAAVLATGRLRLVVPYLAVSGGAFYLFLPLQLVAVRIAEPAALLPLGALNVAAVNLAWEFLLRSQVAEGPPAGGRSMKRWVA